MLLYNFKYELKLLFRSQWIQLLSILLLILFSFSAFNGTQKVKKRENVIAAATKEVEENDVIMLRLLDSGAQGFQVNVPRWKVPASPMAVGNYYPRIAAMKPHAFSFIATGQSDLFTPYVKAKIRDDSFALNFNEMISPVQLLFGSFDLAFVVVYLLPLLIIAFSYNVLSFEKESGSMPLLASQPIKLQTWVLQKLGLRFFWMSVLVFVTMTLVFIFLKIDFIADLHAYVSFIGLIFVYMFFWFVLAFLVNLWGGSSSKNAVSMLGLWVIFVLLIPSVLNQLGNSLYPIPSRTLMINEMRVKKTQVAKKQDEILDNFLRDHPEYAINNASQKRNFWHSYMASQNLVKKELGPVVNAYEEQLQKQQYWVSSLKWISPALTIQESLNKLAGSSTSDYEDYRKQVVAFSEEWKAHFMPFLYNNQEFKTQDFWKLPSFQFKYRSLISSTVIFFLALISMGLLGLGLLISYGNKKHMLIHY